MLLSSVGGELTVPGKNIKVSSSLSLERKDLSGQGSGSSFAAAGDKPQELSVSLVLPFEDKDKLTSLVDAALARDDAGEPLVYDIVDNLAGALRIRQVIFSGTLETAEHDTLQAFSVSFKLQEVKSVAEKLEKNADPKLADANVNGEAVVPGTDPASVNAAIEKATA
jgi:hypothetical protein